MTGSNHRASDGFSASQGYSSAGDTPVAIATSAKPATATRNSRVLRNMALSSHHGARTIRGVGMRSRVLIAALVTLLLVADAAVAGVWQQAPDLPAGVGRIEPSVAAVGGTVYMIGGTGPFASDPTVFGPLTSSVYALAPGASSWQLRASMPAAREAAAVASLHGRVYVIGGRAGGGSGGGQGPSRPVRTVFVYAAGSDQWSTGPSLPAVRSLAQATVSGGKIYVFGGQDRNSQPTRSVFEFDPARHSWRYVTTMPAARTAFAVATDRKGRIYLVGGEHIVGNQITYIRRVDRYDPSTNSWAIRANIPTARSYLSAARGSNGKIYTAAGMRVDAAHPFPEGMNRVEVYDPASDSWSRGPDLRVARLFQGMAAARGSLYVVAGTSTPVDPATCCITAVERLKP